MNDRLKKISRVWLRACGFALAAIVLGILWASQGLSQDLPSQDIRIEMPSFDGPQSVVPAIKILGLLTVLTVAPAIILMMTSFTRILIVLGFVRQALGTQALPRTRLS
jgi:flagellar biosynthesis protein FliP